MPDIPEPAFETPFEGADTVSAPSKDDAIPEEAVQVCPCVCHSDHPGLEHVRACCPSWDGPLGGHVGESQPYIEARVRRQVAEEIAAAILAVNPVEWALAGQHAGQDAARIARQIGEGRD